MTLFSSVATLWKVLWFWLFPPGYQGEIKPTEPWPEKPVKGIDHGDCIEAPPGTSKRPPIPQPKLYAAPKVKPLGKTITKQEDGYLVRTSWQVSTEQEARVYGYAYLGSRMETPGPTPDEYSRIIGDALSISVDLSKFNGEEEKNLINALYSAMLRYFKVQARTWHQAWSLLEDGPYVAEVDTLFAGSQVVHAQVLIPGWAVFNPVYQDQPDSHLKDEDYFVLSCALSVAGTRDTQDVRAEAVQTVTIRELKEA